MAEKQLAKCNLEEDESITFKNEKEHCRIKSPKRSGEDHELSGLYGIGSLQSLGLQGDPASPSATGPPQS